MSRLYLIGRTFHVTQRYHVAMDASLFYDVCTGDRRIARRLVRRARRLGFVDTRFWEIR